MSDRGPHDRTNGRTRGDIECWLTEEPTRFDACEPFETYLRTVVLGAHLERLPPEEHDAFGL